MTKSARSLPPNLPEVGLFWSAAVEYLGWDSMNAIFGEQSENGLLPPVFQFSDKATDATHAAAEVVSGQRTTMSAPLADYKDSGIAPPAEGDLAIICDGKGMPVALIQDVSIEITPSGGPYGHASQVIEHFACRYAGHK